jgi:acyl-CoA reductase-like NAD-dependent aldehyde dehydrogenase
MFDDVPLGAMVAATIEGFTQATGQICVASTRPDHPAERPRGVA